MADVDPLSPESLAKVGAPAAPAAPAGPDPSAISPEAIDAIGSTPIRAAQETFSLLEDFAPEGSGIKLGLMEAAAGQKKQMDARRAVAVASVLQMPVDLVEGNLDEFHRMALDKQFDRNRLIKTSPRITEWMARNPTHAAALQFEKIRMGKMEHLLQLWAGGVGDPFGITGKGPRRIQEAPEARQARYVGGLQVELSMLSNKLWEGEKLSQSEQARMDDIRDTLKNHELFNVEGNFVLKEGVKMSQQLVGGMSESAKYASIFAGATAALGPEAWPLIPIAAGIGGLFGQFSFGQQMTTGLLYDDLIQNGVDRQSARILSLAGGYVSGGLEAVGGKLLGRVMPGVKALLRKPVGNTAKQLMIDYGETLARQSALMGARGAALGQRITGQAVEGLAVEAVKRAGVGRAVSEKVKGLVVATGGETGTEGAQTAVERAAKVVGEMDKEGRFDDMTNPDGVIADLFWRLKDDLVNQGGLEEIGQAALAGAAGALFLGGIGTATTFTPDIIEARQAARRAKFYADHRAGVAQTLRDSGLRGDPMARELVREMLGPNAQGNVYVPLETFNAMAEHNKMTGQQMADTIGERARYDRAVLDGTETVVVPRDNWMVAVADYDNDEFHFNKMVEEAPGQSVKTADERFDDMLDDLEGEAKRQVEEDKKALGFADTQEPALADTGAQSPAAKGISKPKTKREKATGKRVEPVRGDQDVIDRAMQAKANFYRPALPADIIGDKEELARFEKVRQEAMDAADGLILEKLTERVKREVEAKRRLGMMFLRKRVTEDVQGEQVYRAIEAMRNNSFMEEQGEGIPAVELTDIKINRQSLIDLLGKEGAKGLPQRTTTKTGGISVVEAAALFKYDSPEQFIHALKTAIPMKQEIENRIESRAHFEGIAEVSLAELDDLVDQAFHNEKRSKFLHEQLKYMTSEAFASQKKLKRRLARPLPSKKDIRIGAMEHVLSLPLTDLDPKLYLKAEKKARERALDLEATGDLGAVRGSQAFEAELDGYRREYERIEAELRGIDKKAPERRDVESLPARLREAAGRAREVAPRERGQQIVEQGPGSLTEAEDFAGALSEHVILRAMASTFILSADRIEEVGPKNEQDVIKLEAKLDELNRMLEEKGKGARTAVEARPSRAPLEARLQELEEKISRTVGRQGRASDTAQDLFDAKLDELRNAELYRAAVQIKEKFDRFQERNQKWNFLKSQLRIRAKGFVEAIDALRERYGYIVRRSRAPQQTESLAKLVKRLEEEEGSAPVIKDSVFKDMPAEPTVRDQLEGIQAIESLVHVGLQHDGEIVGSRMQKLTEEAAALAASIRANGRAKAGILVGDPSLGHQFKAVTKALASNLQKAEFILERLDGEKAGGVAWNTLMRRMNDAQDVEADLYLADGQARKGIFNRYTKKERRQWYRRGKFFAALNGTFSKANLLLIALNWGNEGNRQALLNGFGWKQEDVQKILDEELTEKDALFVQDIWNHLESYRERVFDLERRQTGITPEAVEGVSTSIGGKTVEGGYYPIVATSNKSLIKRYSGATLNEQAEGVKQMFEVTGSRAMTKHGHTKARKGSSRPLELTFRSLDKHLREVIHDLAFREPVVEANALLRNREVNEALVGELGVDLTQQLDHWVTAIASDRHGEYLAWYDSVLGRVRNAATMVAMGFKASVALVQVTGYTVSAGELGKKYAMVGLKQAYGNPMALPQQVRKVFEASKFMRDRIKGAHDRDILDSMMRMDIPGTTFGRAAQFRDAANQLKRFAFLGIGFMDMAVSIPTWLGAYQKAWDGQLENIDPQNHEDAVAYADRTVRATQGSGQIKDLARAQRGSQAWRLMTMFYQYGSVLYNQLTKTGREFKRTGDVPQLMWAVLMLTVVPAALETVLRGEDKSEEDFETKADFYKYYAKKFGLYPLQSIPLIRDAARSFEFGGRPGATPGMDLFQKAAQGLGAIPSVAIDLAEGETPKRGEARNVSALFGLVFGLPERQIWLTAEGLILWHSGEQVPNTVSEVFRQVIMNGRKRQ